MTKDNPQHENNDDDDDDDKPTAFYYRITEQTAFIRILMKER